MLLERALGVLWGAQLYTRFVYLRKFNLKQGASFLLTVCILYYVAAKVVDPRKMYLLLFVVFAYATLGNNRPALTMALRKPSTQRLHNFLPFTPGTAGAPSQDRARSSVASKLLHLRTNPRRHESMSLVRRVRGCDGCSRDSRVPWEAYRLQRGW